MMEEIADRALYVKFDLVPLAREDKDLTDKLRNWMVSNDVNIITRDGGVIVLRRVVMRKFNLDRFKKDHPSLYEEYRDPTVCPQVWKTTNDQIQAALRDTESLPPPPPEWL